jgi:hypothetical protein
MQSAEKTLISGDQTRTGEIRRGDVRGNEISRWVSLHFHYDTTLWFRRPSIETQLCLGYITSYQMTYVLVEIPHSSKNYPS